MKNKLLILAIIIFIGIISILVISKFQSTGELIQINYEELQEKINQKETFILVVSKSTCSHCATYKPKLTTIAKDYDLDIYYIDYDKESNDDQNEFLTSYNLSGATPMTIFIEKGQETSVLNRIEGDLSAATVIEKFKKMGFIEK